MTVNLGSVALVLMVVLLVPRPAVAHCDTLSGPVAGAARAALESGTLAGVLMWVRDHDEAEVKEAFARARAVRGLSADAQALADMYFFETVVRLHRASEGEPYTGLKTEPVPPLLQEAERAIDAEAVGPLGDALVERLASRLTELHAAVRQQKTLLAAHPGDVAVGRRYIEAYVAFMRFVEESYGTARHDPHAATHTVR